MWLGAQINGNTGYCKLLLHMNGADDGTTFTDDSKGGSGNTVTATNAVTKTAIKKLGSASAYFDGTSYLDVSPITDFNFGTSPFTIQFFIRFTNASGTAEPQIIYNFDNASWSANHYIQYKSNLATPVFTVGFKNGSWSGYNYTPTTALVAGTWYHIALTKTGTTIEFFIDGVSEGTQTINSLFATMPTVVYSKIGYSLRYSNEYLTGYLDEFSIHKGIALYNRNFTPPTRQM
jgi:concanavalin A-like lectin/glucanase superfamily protein